MAYPNPSTNGRFSVTLPEKVVGELTYALVNQAGAVLAEGKVNINAPIAALPFNFSQQMQSTGVYYLQLKGESYQASLKLVRE